MVLFVESGDRPTSPHCFLKAPEPGALRCVAGPKGAPPAIPPIIINPYSHHAPTPSIDPIIAPVGPPLVPPPSPAISLA